MNAEELLSEQIVENINIDDEASEVNGSLQKKKRERLSSVVAGGSSKQYLGKELQLSDIDKMTTEQINKLYCKYEARLGASMTKTLGNSFINLYVMGGIACCRSNKMASALAMMLGGAITNAFAFSGSNYLFSHMGSNANEEKIRHDKAIEKLEKAQSEWNKKRIQRLDFVNEQLQKEHHAEHTFEDVDQAMKQYYYITSKQLTPLLPKPKLSDFYTPIRRSKNREIAFVVGGMVLTGFVVWKLK
ncbi:unnamed protein product [Mytilus coruscus]|uniref:Uncharacterized protein n=1 Tax=Mytilus coruscus TaxID=42192 RepID=A0A6J8DAJ5_MYTCO|nr:unnamed protein product [Mytilus coruscus]